MFGVSPRLPVDSLLGTEVWEVDKDVQSSWEDWVQHQERLCVARSLAHKSLEDAAEYRQQHHNNQVHDAALSKGQLVYLKDHSHQGHRKIQDVWSPVLYQVTNVPDKPGAPYTVMLADGTSKVRRVHRTEMRSARLGDQSVIPQPDLQIDGEEDREACPSMEISTLSVDSLPEGVY